MKRKMTDLPLTEDATRSYWSPAPAVAASPANTGGGVIVPGAVVDPTSYDGDDYQIQFTATDAFDIVAVIGVSVGEIEELHVLRVQDAGIDP